MAPVLTAAAFLFAFAALLLAVAPSLRFWEASEVHVSEETLHIQALAAAQNYTSTVVLEDPLVVYIDNFLSEIEINDLVNATQSTFVKSQVYDPDPDAVPVRTSSSSTLSANTFLQSVIHTRADQFLASHFADAPGSLSYFGFEKVQLVKYQPSQYYHFHVDWFGMLRRDDLPGKGDRGRGRGQWYNRVASFFLYVQDDCEGGDTQFPDLEVPVATDFWSERINFDTASSDVEGATPKGLSFRPRKGSGVFWVNLLPSGYGDERVRHAGLPVTSGEKIGMNIWVKRSFGW